jgi:hypothetical protein
MFSARTCIAGVRYHGKCSGIQIEAECMEAFGIFGLSTLSIACHCHIGHMVIVVDIQPPTSRVLFQRVPLFVVAGMPSNGYDFVNGWASWLTPQVADDAGSGDILHSWGPTCGLNVRICSTRRISEHTYRSYWSNIANLGIKTKMRAVRHAPMEWLVQRPFWPQA